MRKILAAMAATGLFTATVTPAMAMDAEPWVQVGVAFELGKKRGEGRSRLDFAGGVDDESGLNVTVTNLSWQRGKGMDAELFGLDLTD